MHGGNCVMWQTISLLIKQLHSQCCYRLSILILVYDECLCRQITLQYMSPMVYRYVLLLFSLAVECYANSRIPPQHYQIIHKRSVVKGSTFCGKTFFFLKRNEFRSGSGLWLSSNFGSQVNYSQFGAMFSCRIKHESSVKSDTSIECGGGSTVNLFESTYNFKLQ